VFIKINLNDHDSVDRFCSSLAPYFVLWVGLFFPLVNHLREGVLLPKDIGTNACLARQGTQRYLRRFLVHRCFVEVSFAEVIYAPVRDRIEHLRHHVLWVGCLPGRETFPSILAQSLS
jgi:hypothetical protein